MSQETPRRSIADDRMLSFFVKLGRITREQAAAANSLAARDRISALEALDRLGSLREEDAARVLAEGLRLPLLHLPTVPFDETAIKALNQSLAARFTVVPIRIEKDALILALTNPFDQELVKEIEFRTGRRIRQGVARRAHVIDAIERYYKMSGSLETLLSGLPDSGGVSVEAAAKDDLDALSLVRQAEEAPVVKMVNLILMEALKERASDVHIEPGPNLVLVRYRINGVLQDALQVPNWVQSPLTARIKVLAKLDITERRVPQDGRMRIRTPAGIVDLRVSSLPTAYGEKIVMRVLDPATALRRLDAVGLSSRDLGILSEAIRKPEGMILATGPTGSGKTTTLYAIIQEILSPELNIVTIENPIEYEMKGVAQVEVNEKQGLSFAGALRSILRQDPDVILVGEIRDAETAEVAFQAAQTGHLVLSTLHTNDTAATITRLIDLGIEPYLLASSLHAIVAQRLARTVCAQCAEPLPVDEEVRRVLGIGDVTRVRHGTGCAACHRTGYDARTGVYEVLRMTRAMQQLVESRAPESAIRLAAEREGMTPLLTDAVGKIEAGRTTPEEVLRVIEVAARGPECPRCLSPIENAFTVCPFCLFQLRNSCASCGVILKKEWQTCPFCGNAAANGEPAGATSPSVVAVSEAAAPPPEIVPLPAISGMIEEAHVLVVDDNDDVRALVRAALERGPKPMVVEEASNGYEALGKVEMLKPHLIVLDIMMPGMDGFDVCKRLRANLQTALIPIIMLTARGDPESKTEGFLSGTDDYLVKPFDRHELAARVQRLLERTYSLPRQDLAAEAPA